MVLNHGEWLGNIEIVKPIIVLRSSVLYEARHQKARVLLKVAHPGPENRERLKREAEFLKSVQSTNTLAEYMPRLLPPYTATSLEREPYGKVVLRDHLLYYCLYEHFAGEPLRDILVKNTQMWVYHIGWIMIHLASAVAFLQSQGRFHFAISPDTVLIRLDEATGAPGILLFDLGIASDLQGLRTNWYPFSVHPAYTAPELIDGGVPHATYATDVYGLGLTLYELLVGEPPYPYKLASEKQVKEAVKQGRRVSMTRSEDVRAAAEIAEKAVSSDLDDRFAHAAEMVQALKKCFGEVPEVKRPFNRKLLLFVVGALLVITLLIVVQMYS